MLFLGNPLASELVLSLRVTTGSIYPAERAGIPSSSAYSAILCHRQRRERAGMQAAERPSCRRIGRPPRLQVGPPLTVSSSPFSP